MDINKYKEMNKIKKNKKKQVYKTLYEMCCKKIESIATSGITECWYQVPDVILGKPKYELEDCCKYIIKELGKSSFKEIKYFKPNIIYTNWDNDSDSDNNQIDSN